MGHFAEASTSTGQLVHFQGCRREIRVRGCTVQVADSPGFIELALSHSVYMPSSNSSESVFCKIVL